MRVTSCANCRFWQKFKNTDKFGEGKGQCRVHAPRVHTIPKPDGIGSITIFPQTEHDGWCGEGIENE